MTNKIAVCSMFRDSVLWGGIKLNHIDRYFTQMTNQSYGVNNLDFYLLEGDSQDKTYSELTGKVTKYKLTNNIGFLGQKNNYHIFDTTSSKSRIESLACVANYLLGQIKNIEQYAYILWIESDFIINNDLIEKLVNTSKQLESITGKKQVVAPFPIINLGDKSYFYDTWGFVSMNGRKWKMNTTPSGMIEKMLSIGSCALIDAELFSNYRINFGTEAFIGLCHQARNAGADIHNDSTIIIEHPNNRVQNRWV